MLWVLFLIAFAVFVYYCVYKPHNYWKERGVKCSKPVIPIVGNFGSLVIRRKNLLEYVVQLYNEYPNDRYNGVYQFNRPILLIRDLELIKKICVKDFDHFSDHTGIFAEETETVFSKSLISLRGQQWREMRATLSPAFTSSKMKMMFNFMVDCANDFTKHFLKKNEKVTPIEMKDAFTRYTNDVIATTAFGCKCDSFEDPANEFFANMKKVTNFGGFQSVKVFLIHFCPDLAKALRLKLFPQALEDFFSNLVRRNIQEREEKGIVRPDMIHLLMEARKGKLKYDGASNEESSAGFATAEESSLGKLESLQKRELTDNDITAQALLFFFAGFETSSTLSCFMAHELAVNPDIQIKLQNEVDDVLEKHGKVTYEVLLSMKYLDQVVSESLRLWTPGFQAERMCVKDYNIEPLTPEEKSLLIEKGQTIAIPSAGIHRNPEYFPNPEKFDPDRFSDENKDKIIPGSFMPFGVGPRNCIGSRFALLEVKVLFFQILSIFDIVVVEKTCVPLKLSRKKFILTADGGFWLGLKPRKNTSL